MNARAVLNHLIVISIHAPRGGSDVWAAVVLVLHHNFNPRSPWGERLEDERNTLEQQVFQSTLPVGGATR